MCIRDSDVFQCCRNVLSIFGSQWSCPSVFAEHVHHRQDVTIPSILKHRPLSHVDQVLLPTNVASVRHREGSHDLLAIEHSAMQLMGLVVVNEVLYVRSRDAHVVPSHSVVELVPSQIASGFWVVVESSKHLLDTVLWNEFAIEEEDLEDLFVWIPSEVSIAPAPRKPRCTRWVLYAIWQPSRKEEPDGVFVFVWSDMMDIVEVDNAIHSSRQYSHVNSFL
eukprot:TRINITY_DN10379_c0_g1_i7.p1 TRINITY_DN10379_c0_g1~~TRINITY_DN10379_c0_g1_i7.p1  ORF type:complete len:221 (-),score=5.92 TRINITY_DN10379_c0_g1_i7:127-789(-)